MGILVSALLLLCGSPAWAADGGPATDAGSPARAARTAPDGGATPESTEIAALATRAGRIRALQAGKLALDVDPASLFDVALGDPIAVQVEQRRIAAVLASVSHPDAGAVTASARKPPKRAKPAASPRAAADAGSDAAPAPADALWNARLDLDRATLAFLSLSKDKRDQLLAQHAAAQKAASASSPPNQGLSDAEKKARQAAEERQKALQDIQRARSEAVRVVAEERARLLGVREQQAKFETQLILREHASSKRAEETLAWRRRVSELIDKRRSGDVAADAADSQYDDLVKTLRSARADLSSALDAVRAGASDVPRVGPDRLDVAGAVVDRSAVDKLRKELLAQEQSLETRDRNAAWEQARTLLEQVEQLNRDRLALYPWLTSARRDALTSFSATGVQQARAEAWQVALVTRYHAFATVGWVVKLKDFSHDRTREVLATVSALKIAAFIVFFVWWRRRVDGWLERLLERASEAERASRRPARLRAAVRALRLVRRVRGPLEWLFATSLVLGFLGPGVKDLLEARLVWIVAGWTLGGAAVVNGLDAVLANGRRRKRLARTDKLRLRSLKLVGRVIVAVGLTLGLTAALVGKGTIYSWVLSTCWFAALPVGLIVLRWWRSVIFERIDNVRKKNAFTARVSAHQQGWASFLAAVGGAGYLTGIAAAELARRYVSTFNVTRRVLAYLFRREMAKQAKERDTGQHRPLELEHYPMLDPDRPAPELVPTVADSEVDDVVRCIDAPGGGVFAVVGERGSGKSTLLQRIHELRNESVVVRCPPGGMTAFRAELARALELDPASDDEAIKRRINEKTTDNALLVDDAQRLVRPTIGGLDDLDALLALARESSTSCTWVFCIGSVIWQYVERARGARPLFDEVIVIHPWSEDGITALLRSRSAAAGMDPRFDDLIAEEEADPELRAEQLKHTEASYYRLLWDYASGNPGVAIHFWRELLSVDEADNVMVQLFVAPDSTDLESLPDSAVFVLRAIVQLEVAAVEDVLEATMLPPREVYDAIRYELFRGYLELRDGRYRVHWGWFRAVTRLLERRHLLVGTRS